MNSDLFLNKLNNYFNSRSDFLSVEQLNSCFNKFKQTGFSPKERIISGDQSNSCETLFTEDELNVALLFLENGTVTENLKENSETLLNRYTYNNFRNRSISLFTKTGIVLRGTRYV